MDNVTPSQALLKAMELAELEKWATAAPWIMNDIKPSQYRVGSNATGKALADMRYKNGVHDGRFIAALRNAFPSLHSELERLHAENAKLRQLIPLVPTFTFGCHGDKCRLGVCYSCCGEECAEEQAKKASDLISSLS